MQQKAKQISELQVKWLSNGKRLYEESSPTVVNPLSKDPKNCIGSKAKPRKRTRWLQEAEAGRRGCLNDVDCSPGKLMKPV